jgi:hypothetical protein
MTDALPMWTVYAHPLDYPDSFVARRFLVDANGSVSTDDIMREDALDVLRARLMRLGLTCITRSPQDEPQIVETWL